MELIRTAAAAAALCAGTALGWRKRCALRDRTVFLAEIEQLLERFSANIEFSARTSDELLANENGQFALLVKSYKEKCGDFRKAWESACETLPKNAYETTLLKQLGQNLGTSDKANTVHLLRCCHTEIAALKSAADAEYSKQGKAFFQVGTLCGIGAAVLLI